MDVDGLWLRGKYVAIALDLAEASEVYENITSVESISLHALCLQSTLGETYLLYGEIYSWLIDPCLGRMSR